MMKRAMTYLEVVLSMIIISIIIYLSYPKFNDDTLEVARDQLITHLKYIAYMATLHDNFDITDKNFKGKLWQIRFHHSIDKEAVLAYTIFRDKNVNSRFDKSELEFDILSQKFLAPASFNNLSLKDKRQNIDPSSIMNKFYGIEQILFPIDKCLFGFYKKSRKLLFDKYGQVYIAYRKSSKRGAVSGGFDSYLIAPKCGTYTITLKKSSQSVGICIETQTGYVYKCRGTI